MRPTVVVSEALHPACAKWLVKHVDVVHCLPAEPEKLRCHLPTAAGLVISTYTHIDDAFLQHAPQLQVIGRAGVGLDQIDLEACKQHGVQVVYTPQSNTQAVVEYVLALIMDALRPRLSLSQAPCDDDWHKLRKEQVGMQLDQLTLGILGFGRIGKRLGQVAATIGMKVLVNDLLPQADLRKAVDYPYDFVDKDQLYRQSDVLSIHVDGRTQNRHMINAEVLGRFNPRCLLINAARGMLIDADALADWLRHCPEARAVLDVHEPEPIEPDYPLLQAPSARILPHVASRTHTAMENMSWVVRDVVAVLEGQPPRFSAV